MILLKYLIIYTIDMTYKILNINDIVIWITITSLIIYVFFCMYDFSLFNNMFTHKQIDV